MVLAVEGLEEEPQTALTASCAEHPSPLQGAGTGLSSARSGGRRGKAVGLGIEVPHFWSFSIGHLSHTQNVLTVFALLVALELLLQSCDQRGRGHSLGRAMLTGSPAIKAAKNCFFPLLLASPRGKGAEASPWQVPITHLRDLNVLGRCFPFVLIACLLWSTLALRG